MKFLSKDEAALWCRQNEIILSDRGTPERVRVATKFHIPPDAQHRVLLVAQRMAAFEGSREILVWFTEWDVWVSGSRMHVFNRFRMSYGETRPLIQTPGHLFETHEFEDAISFVTLGVLFLWDCHILTAKQTKFLFFSHDEFGLEKGTDLT